MALSGPQSLRDLPDSPPPDWSPYRRRRPETWDQAREDYLSGLSAPDVCERHDLGLSNFRARARKEGWRRSDQPDPDIPSFEEEAAADAGPMPSFRDQAEHARRAMNRAQARGQVLQAHRWLRLHRDQIKEAEAEEAAARAAETRAQLKTSPEVQAELDALRQTRQRLIGAEIESMTRLANASRRRLQSRARAANGDEEPDGPDDLDPFDEDEVHEVHAESDPSQPWLTRPHDADAIEALRERIRRRREHGIDVRDLPDPALLEAERLAAAPVAEAESTL